MTRSRERRKLMVELLERKVRLRARQLYDERGQVKGSELEDWVRAESEVLKSSILAPLWNKRESVEVSGYFAPNRSQLLDGAYKSP
jgi:hypothetical protein